VTAFKGWLHEEYADAAQYDLNEGLRARATTFLDAINMFPRSIAFARKRPLGNNLDLDTASELDDTIKAMMLSGADFADGTWIVLCDPQWRKEFNEKVREETGLDISKEKVYHRSKIGLGLEIVATDDAPPGKLIVMRNEGVRKDPKRKGRS
jgi:hypothetical protein